MSSSPLDCFMVKNFNRFQIKQDNARVHNTTSCNSRREIGDPEGREDRERNGGEHEEGMHLVGSTRPLHKFFQNLLLERVGMNSFHLLQDNAHIPKASNNLFEVSSGSSSSCRISGESRWDPYEGEKNLPMRRMTKEKLTFEKASSVSSALSAMVAEHHRQFLPSKQLRYPKNGNRSTFDLVNEALDLCVNSDDLK